MKEVQLRDATLQDGPAILEIMNENIANTTAIYEETLRTDSYIQNWFETKQKGGFPIVAAIVENELAGYATYGAFRPFEGFRFTVEHSVYVNPKFQGLGIGKKLLRAIIEKAKEANLHVIIAGIDAANEASIRLHKQFLFEEVGRLPQTGYKFGKWLDLVFLRLQLKEN